MLCSKGLCSNSMANDRFVPSHVQDKARNAEDGGALGIIVINTEKGLLRMPSGSTQSGSRLSDVRCA